MHASPSSFLPEIDGPMTSTGSDEDDDCQIDPPEHSRWAGRSGAAAQVPALPLVPPFLPLPAIPQSLGGAIRYSSRKPAAGLGILGLKNLISPLA